MEQREIKRLWRLAAIARRIQELGYERPANYPQPTYFQDMTERHIRRHRDAAGGRA